MQASAHSLALRSVSTSRDLFSPIVLTTLLWNLTEEFWMIVSALNLESTGKREK